MPTITEHLTRPDARTRPPADAEGGNGLTRLTINMTASSMRSLNAVSSATGNSKTDTVNRAVQAFEVLHDLLRRGDGSLLVKLPNGDFERVYIVA